MIIDDVLAEHQRTGRDIREILDALRDEGYIQATDDELDEIETECRGHCR